MGLRGTRASRAAVRCAAKARQYRKCADRFFLEELQVGMPRILIKDVPCAILILAIERSVHAVMEWLRLASLVSARFGSCSIDEEGGRSVS